MSNFKQKYNYKTPYDNTINYYPGRKFTSEFGLVPGPRINKDGTYDMKNWDSMYIHTGIDRGTKLVSKNIVYAPFNFDKATFTDFKGEGYGSLLSLINSEYDFEFRIAHMLPKNVLIKDMYKEGEEVGIAGNYGIGTAAHLHSEIISLSSTCKVLDDLLDEFYTDNKWFDDQSIIKIYKEGCKLYKTDGEILTHFNKERKRRRVNKINKYKYTYLDGEFERTRYSTRLLFNI